MGASDEIRHPQPAVAARFAVLMTASLCRELILFRPASEPGSVPLSDEELIEELSRVMTGYLRSGVGHAPSRRQSKRKRGKNTT